VTVQPRTPLPPLRETVRVHGLSASKALGQNFLFDEQLLDRIAALPGDLKGATVFEVVRASGVTRRFRVPELAYPAPEFKSPPQPETYTFWQRSTRKATGLKLGELAFLPKVVEYISAERSGRSLVMNCLELSL
jgi:hypothetical protein